MKSPVAEDPTTDETVAPPPAAPGASLKHRAVRGGVFTLASQWVRFGLRIGTFVVLSRLLVKDDFGLVAMVTAFTGFAALFADAGLTQAATRARQLTGEQASSLFWVNVAVAVAVAALLALCSPLIARFYGGEERLVPITLVSSLAIVLGALRAQHQAMLQRELRFGWLAAAEIASQLVGAIVAITVAAVWRTYWALVVQPIVTQLLFAVTVWSATGWRPGRPRIARGTRGLVMTGTHLSGSDLLNYVQINSDLVILGKYEGTGPLGEYSRAMSLLLMPLTQIMSPFTRVAVPLMARLQDQPERFARAFYRMAALVAIISTPLIAVLVVCARDIIAIALGPNFEEAGTLFQILALALWGMPTGASTTWVAIAAGRTRELLRRNFIKTTLAIVGFLIGVRWGAVGVAWAYVLFVHTLRYPMMYWALHRTPATIGGLMRATWPGTFVGVVGAGVMAVPTYLMDLPKPYVSLVVAVAIGSVAMAGMCYLWPKARHETAEAIDIMKSMRRG